jgi:glucose/arabinose dehydrogenase
VACLAAVLAACSDTTLPPTAATVEVIAPRAQVAVGDTLQLNAVAQTSSGTSLAEVQFSWSSSDESVVGVSADGQVMGRAPGTATVVASTGGARGEARITVVPAAVATIALAPDTATLLVGDTRRLAAVLRDARGAELAGRAVRWSSDDEAVAAVAADGTVTARTAGSATITAESEGRKAIANVTVIQPPVPALALEVAATGLGPSPTYLTAPPGDGRLFVVSLAGQVRIVQGGRVLPTPFLDLSDRVGTGGEMGLFSLAFHPRYASNGYFYVAYTDRGADLRVERYRVSADRDVADPASARLVLSVDPPAAMHFGGLVKFGPDGKLYVGVGEGGSPESAQDRGVLTGKLLRIDVDAGDPYAIPADNPFAGQAGARGEIWAMGLRNPWRWSIDRETGLLYIADVGSNFWEEVNVAPVTRAGLNYGWPRMEGDFCWPESETGCDRTGLTVPALAYGHGDRGTGHPWGCSITGGYVYRGRRMPGLRGHYFYGDFCKGWIRSFRYVDGKATDLRGWDFPGMAMLMSFGEDGDGELYVVRSNGTLYRIVQASTASN